MTFLNATLLIALAGVAIPIALHFIARKEPRQVTFPSVRLLTQRFQTNRSKVRIRRWWLLALRIAAIAAVALAMARPVIASALSLTWTTLAIIAAVGVVLLVLASLTAGKPDQRRLMWALFAAALVALIAAIGWGGYTLASGRAPDMDRSTPVALAIVVDNLALADWSDGQTSQLDRIRDAAKQLVMAANPNSRIAVVDRSATPAAFSLDLASAVSKADSLSTQESVQPLESRLEAAARLLTTSEIESRQLVLISAMGRSSFGDDPDASRFEELLSELGVRLTLWDIDDSERDRFAGMNRQVSIPTLSDQSPAPGATINVAAVLSISPEQAPTSENGASDPVGSGLTGSDLTGSDLTDSDLTDSDSADKGLNVTAECVLFPASPSLPVLRDGQIVRPQAKPVDRTSAVLVPGRDVEIQMALPPLPVGLHHGAIRLIGSDALPIDDVGYFTITVSPPSRLLIVADDLDEAAELARTVSAPVAVNSDASQYAIETVAMQDIQATRLTDFDAVILLDPPAGVLEEPEVVRYRAAGGNVLLNVGKELGSDPVTFAGVTLQRPWRVPEPGTFLEITAASHPAMFTLANLPGGVPFQDFRVLQYWQVEGNGNWQTLARYAGTGHPAIIEIDSSSNDSDQAGSPDQAGGKTLLVTTPLMDLADPVNAWNELFLADEPWPAFWLVRDLTRYLAGRGEQNRTSFVGSAVTVPVSYRAADSEQRRLQWFPPVGNTPIPIDVPADFDRADESAGEVLNESTQAGRSGGTGRLLIGRPKHSGVHWIRGDATGLGFTVNLDRDQLSSLRLDRTELEKRFGTDETRFIDSIDEMEWTAGDAAAAVPLWSPIMLLALLVFLLEQILSNRFYRGASAGASGSGKAPRRSAA